MFTYSTQGKRAVNRNRTNRFVFKSVVCIFHFSEKECADALSMFNGRWYAQRQLSCEYCPVQKWKTAICGKNAILHSLLHATCSCSLSGLFERGRCPKGKHCNFLHVFRNPGGAFARADRDLPASSERSEERTTPERQGKCMWLPRPTSFWLFEGNPDKFLCFKKKAM